MLLVKDDNADWDPFEHDIDTTRPCPACQFPPLSVEGIERMERMERMEQEECKRKKLPGMPPHIKKEILESRRSFKCPICYREENEITEQVIESIQVTVCGHFFCGTCLSKWLKTNSTCPECRKQIVV